MRCGWRRNIGIVLAVSVIFGNLPVYGAVSARAAEGLCAHHPSHTEECGYQPETPGEACHHEHTDACYTPVTECIHEHNADCYPILEEERDLSEETAQSEEDAALQEKEETDQPELDQTEPTECEHVCSEENGCITKKLDCSHERDEHDETCGYVPAEPGTPCSYVCEICRSQEETEGGETNKAEHTDKPDSIDKTEKEKEKSQENQPEDKKPGNTGTKDAPESDNAPEVEERVSTPSNAVEMPPEQMKAMKNVLAVENPVASVTIDEETTEYASFVDAMKAANGKTATITLLRSTNETLKMVAVMGGSITLQLNGQSLTDINEGFCVYGGTVTITGEGTISYMSMYGGRVIVKGGNIGNLQKQGGKVTVKGGSIEEVAGTIDEYEPQSISLSQNTLFLAIGKTGTLTATVTPSISAPGFGYTWTSSDPSVATVSGNGANATVTAISAGEVTITVTAGTEKAAECTVKVTEAQSSTVSVSITGTGVSENSGTYSAVYGSDITATADIAAASTGTKTRAAEKNTLDFYLGSIADENKLNEKPITVTDNKAAMTLTLTGEKWKAGMTYTIFADFGGSSTLTGSSGTAKLTVNPIPLSEPGNLTLTSTAPGKAAASWDEVSNASGYSVQLYKNGKPQGSPVSVKDGTVHTFENITEKGSYTVRVIAKGDGNYADSEEAESNALPFYPATVENDGHGSSAGSGGSSSGSSSSASVYVPENGTWRQDETGWWFEKKDGGCPADMWYECVWNGKKFWYHFNGAGYLDSGWFTDQDGNRYFLHDLHDGSFGYMYTGWHWIGGACYYFNPVSDQNGLPYGALYKNCMTPDGYQVNGQGQWTTI